MLPPFSPLFASLVNILQCDVLLGMLGAVLQWAVEPSGGHWSESMLQRVSVVLYLFVGTLEAFLSITACASLSLGAPPNRHGSAGGTAAVGEQQ